MESEGGDDMAKAEAFLQMTTAKLTKVRASFRGLWLLPAPHPLETTCGVYGCCLHRTH